MCNKRLCVVLLVIIAVAGVFSWRLFVLQVEEGGMWKARAQGQQKEIVQLQGNRGNIYLNGVNNEPVLVATNKKVYHAYISPRELKFRGEDKEKLARDFADVLQVEEEEVLQRMQRDSAYEVLKRNLSDETGEIVRKTDGIHLQEEVTRHYPEERLASHVLGFVGGENKGQYGVEQYYEDILKGKAGIREGLKNPLGSLFITRDSTRSGESISLTIDYNVQYFVEQRLKEAVERIGAKEGIVLVGDPRDGKILAMANYPDFNPNLYPEEETKIFKNMAIQESFEPGSVFKPLTMAIALSEEAVSPNDTFYDTGEKRIHGRVLRNYDRRSYGEVDMSRILENSINTGIIYVKDQVGNEKFLQYLYDFGLFEHTGVDLHGEVFSSNMGFLEGHEVNFATASYGHGIETTAIQLLRAFFVLANGGEMVEPHIVEREEEHEGERNRIISEEASFLVTEMMVNTIEEGFGRTARVPGYYIAGKTGTAQIPWSSLGISKRGYSNETIQGFIGFAPAFDPEFVILVQFIQPQTRTAELSAAPVFKEVAEFLFEYKKIPFDYER